MTSEAIALHLPVSQRTAARTVSARASVRSSANQMMRMSVTCASDDVAATAAAPGLL
jgi:hypothetical protein